MVDRSVWAILLILAGFGCEGSEQALPPIHPWLEEAREIRLGMSTADLQIVRPELEVSPEGFYREWLNSSTIVTYGFLPWAEGGSPAPGAHLEGLEIRSEMWDSAAFERQWDEGVKRTLAATSAAPVCAEKENLRYREKRAIFSDSVSIAVVAESHVAGDGQDREFFLSTRVETEKLREVMEGRGTESTPSTHDRVFSCPTR